MIVWERGNLNDRAFPAELTTAGMSWDYYDSHRQYMLFVDFFCSLVRILLANSSLASVLWSIHFEVAGLSDAEEIVLVGSV